jgi:predicted DNA-binding transcriptional regulator AlpA
MSRRPRLHDDLLPEPEEPVEPVEPEEPVEPVEPEEPVDPLDLLDKRDLMRILKISQPTLDRWRRLDPTFPACRWLGPATPRWDRREVDKWVASRPAGGLSPAWTALKQRPHERKRKKKAKRTDGRSGSNDA